MSRTRPMTATKRETTFDTDAIEFGNRLNDIIHNQGLTQFEVAELAGLSSTYVSRITLGCHMPTLRTLLALRKALGCTWDEMLGEDS